MKALFTVLLLFFSVSLFAQIPNPSFENWTGYTPDGWYANNLPTVWTTVYQSPTAHSGSSAARGEVVTYQGTPVSPYLQTGNTMGVGFPITTKPASLKGWYQFNSVGGDEFDVAILVYKGTTLVGGNAIENPTAVSSYTQFAFDITYFSQEMPDQCIIQIAIGNGSGDPHQGSYFLVDDLEFSDQTVGVDDGNIVHSFRLDQNYPNPFNPSTKIKYEIPSESFVTLKIFDAIGNEITTLVNETKTAGVFYAVFDAAGLSSGMYFYKLTAGSSSIVKKMMLLK